MALMDSLGRVGQVINLAKKESTKTNENMPQLDVPEETEDSWPHSGASRLE